MKGKICENCGSPKYEDLGCVWCDEQNYIDYQEMRIEEDNDERTTHTAN